MAQPEAGGRRRLRRAGRLCLARRLQTRPHLGRGLIEPAVDVLHRVPGAHAHDLELVPLDLLWRDLATALAVERVDHDIDEVVDVVEVVPFAHANRAELGLPRDSHRPIHPIRIGAMLDLHRGELSTGPIDLAATCVPDGDRNPVCGQRFDEGALVLRT